MKTVSIVTPTFNSMRTLKEYMAAICGQDYSMDCIELIIADGGSADGTLEFLRKEAKKVNFPIIICHNSLKTAEAGKALGVKKARNEIILLLDSDNIIPDRKWLRRMMQPFAHPEIVASEPIRYTYRKRDGVINRYCALIGMNDPLCMAIGNYDRYCTITNKWTEVKREEADMGGYLSVKFREDMIPTIGANGFLMRRNEMRDNFEGDYLFDIDVLWELFKKNPDLRVAKVKTGIVHLFCPDFQTFYRKQNRRIADFIYFSDTKGRKYPWGKVPKSKIAIFCIECVTIVPLLFQAMLGQARKPDIQAWMIHPLMCWITLWVYGMGTIKGLFVKEQADRSNWKQ